MSLVLVVVLSLIVAGLIVVGGPMAARQERFDLDRYSDLEMIARHLVCIRSGSQRDTLPQDLDLESLRSGCGLTRINRSHLSDRESGEPYRYLRIDDRHFEVCANFSDAQGNLNGARRQTTEFAEFDAGTGCLIGAIPDPG